MFQLEPYHTEAVHRIVHYIQWDEDSVHFTVKYAADLIAVWFALKTVYGIAAAIFRRVTKGLW